MYDYDRRANQGEGSAEFMTLLESHLSVGDRQVTMHNKSLGTSDSVFINFINLPHGIGGAGGGAEAENNRALFEVHGFDKKDEHAPPPTGKVKVEMLKSALYSGEGAPSRETRVVLRARTGTPEQIAKYLASWLNQVSKTVEPRFTHSTPPK